MSSFVAMPPALDSTSSSKLKYINGRSFKSIREKTDFPARLGPRTTFIKFKISCFCPAQVLYWTKLGKSTLFQLTFAQRIKTILNFLAIRKTVAVSIRLKRISAKIKFHGIRQIILVAVACRQFHGRVGRRRQIRGWSGRRNRRLQYRQLPKPRLKNLFHHLGERFAFFRLLYCNWRVNSIYSHQHRKNRLPSFGRSVLLRLRQLGQISPSVRLFSGGDTAGCVGVNLPLAQRIIPFNNQLKII